MQPSSQFDALELVDHTVWNGRVECTLTVDEPAIERAYRVAADYDVEHGEFSRVRVTAVWDQELDERPMADVALSAAIARYLECHCIEWLHDKLHALHEAHWGDVAAHDWLDARELL
jgi:hypothetical protein